MTNRAQRRSEMARYRHDAGRALITYLLEPTDPALADLPLREDDIEEMVDNDDIRRNVVGLFGDFATRRTLAP